MTLMDLTPQFFDSYSVTQLPSIDFYNYALSQLPQVYQNAPNFTQTLLFISQQKQNLYDIIRSLVNVYNLNDTGAGITPAPPYGIYLKMLAAVFNAPYTQGQEDNVISTSIKNTVCFVNSRGYPSDFYRYFYLNGLAGYFTNANIEEDGNASIFINVPVPDTPLTPPSPYQIFVNSMNKLKGAGIFIVVTGLNIPFFQLGSLPTDSPPYEVAPGNAGFGVLTPDGATINGGFFATS
jgi:hypothetical protein